MLNQHTTPVLDAMTDPGRGTIDPVRLATILHVTLSDLAGIAGLHRNTLGRAPTSPKAQERLGAVVRVLIDASDLMDGNMSRTSSWFMTMPLTGFAGRTAADLVRSGHEKAVHVHLEMLRDGGYA